jgi:hypothetical protein
MKASIGGKISVIGTRGVQGIGPFPVAGDVSDAFSLTRTHLRLAAIDPKEDFVDVLLPMTKATYPTDPPAPDIRSEHWTITGLLAF